MKYVLLLFALSTLSGCASFERTAADPWAPALPATPQLETRAFQSSTEYPAYTQDQIDALLSDRNRFARNGNPLEEQVIIQQLRKRGVSFETVPQSFLWIPYPLTQASGWESPQRALFIVRQTPKNLERIERIFAEWEAERQKSRQR